jgi:allantoicase
MADILIAPGLVRLNSLSDREATSEFLVCCGSAAWAANMATARPFRHLDHLLTTAGRIWNSLAPNDWLEAFQAHPRIGQPAATPRAAIPDPVRARSNRWSADEQARVGDASDDVQSRLDEGNRCYEARFGYLFIVCATGRTATDLLERLLSRLGNEPDAELRVAAAEQLRITDIRLRRLAGDDTGLE